MIEIAVALAGMGLVSLLTKRTLLGMMIGSQLFILGSTMIFVVSGLSTGRPIEGHLFGMFVLVGGIAQLIVGFGLAIRLFSVRKRVGMEHLKSLKH